MKEKKDSNDAYDFSEDECQELCTQSGAHEVIEAVRHYNEIVSLSRFFEKNEVDALLKKEAEEEDTKVFLEGIFDLAEKRNS